MIMRQKGELEELVEEQLSHIGDPFDQIEYINKSLKDPGLNSDERQYLVEKNSEIIERTRKDSKTDGLTKADNRKSFDDDLAKYISQVRRNSVRYGVQENRSLSLLMIDVDNFKQYNDAYGHLKGDQVLKDVAETLGKYSRGARVYRYGGEEFAILMPETSPEEAEKAANRLNRCIKGKTDVTVSIGIANYTAHVKDHYRVKCFDNAPDTPRPFFERDIKDIFEELVEKADKAMYYAKAEGRNRAILYSPTLAHSFNTEAVK